MKKNLLILTLMSIALFVHATGFQERFALADDRESVLTELLPGSDDAFYYRALNFLNKGDFNHFTETMDAWQQSRKNNWPPAKARELLNREALLHYPADQQKSLKYLSDELNLHFNHSRRDASQVVNLPSIFDNALISRDNLLKKHLRERPRDVERIDPEGYHLLQGVKLNEDQRYDLLKKLQRPDFKGLVDLIDADLKERKGAAFGQVPVHFKLTLDQLNDLAGKRPDLWRSENFVNTCLLRLVPPDEVDMTKELNELNAYYSRVWEVIGKLIPDFNSLKANLLYNWLQNDLLLGKISKENFVEYLKFPRNAYYAPQPVNQLRAYALDFRKSYNDFRLPPINNEEPLVRKILLQLLKDAKDTSEFEPWLKTEFLREVFAEAKVTSGQGSPDEWASWMNRSKYDALKRRIDVDFADDNPVSLGPDAPVVLSAYIKNVKSLIVKVYEINTLNCYRETGKPVDLSMNLNGLTATYEQHHEYKEPELIRVRREFKFPELKNRGVYIIELIGNGKSSRALIQKGHLKVVEEVTAGGHAFSVYDENSNPVKDCTGWFNASPFKAREDGRIYIPFADGKNDPDDPFAASGDSSQKLVVSSAGYSTLVNFVHRPEVYDLDAGFYVDRESLMAGEEAEVVVRPRLALNGCRVALSLLQKPKLSITSTDLDGVESKSVINIEKLVEEDDFIHKFRVPDRCVRLAFSLEGKVENMALNREQDLSAGKPFDFNVSERSKDISHVFLNRHADGYTLEVRGRNGEPMPDVPVNLVFKHQLFTEQVYAGLKSDKSGVVQLGELREIDYFNATWDGVGNRRCTWQLDENTCTSVSELHGISGSILRLAVAENLNLDEDVSLLELRCGAYVKDWHSALSLKNGYLCLNGLSAGNYELRLDGKTPPVSVKVTAAKNDSRCLVSNRMSLDLPKLRPLAVASVSNDGKNLQVQLSEVSKYTRVHIIATRYLPEFDLFDSLETDQQNLLSMKWNLPGCYYKSGRDIGDEYRYILERQHVKKYPGNMLERPGLLIAPWSKQETVAENERLAKGETFGAMSDKASALRSGGRALRQGARGGMGLVDSVGSCDFLKNSAAVFYNLKPDKEGKVSVPLDALKGNSCVRVSAVDPETLIVRDFALPQTAIQTRERRLVSSLNPQSAFQEKQKASALSAGEAFEIKGAASARFEIYDSVAKLYRLFTALSNDGVLKEFAFITEWNTYAPERKQELYSKYACHELNLFLYFKDRDFFNKVVKSFVANKRDKRFVDDWLLGSDLTRYCSGLPYACLNAAERALLAQRIAGRKELAARDLREQVEILPVDQERLNHLFDTALQGRALDAGGEGGELALKELLEDEEVADGKGVQMFRRTALADESRNRAVNAVAFKKKAEEKQMAAPKPAAAAPAVRAEAGKVLAAMDAFAEADRDGFSAGLEVRKDARRLFQKLESTKEWAENNYYQLPVEQQNADLIKPDVFWQEFAEHKGETGFISGNVAEAANSFAEMMLALAVMDLPFDAKEHEESRDAAGFKMTAASPSLVYYRQVQTGERDPDAQALVAQRFFSLDDRYRFEGNERFDKIVTKEFLKRIVYGAQVVLTNPTGNRMKLRILLQIPQGSLPVLGGFYTKGFYITLEPYATHKQEYFFYFPERGEYRHYPVTVSCDGMIAGQAASFVFNVVDQLSEVDKESWAWLSQNGSTDQVSAYLQGNNIHRITLNEIAWRMKDKDYFSKVIDLLSDRGVYDAVLWSYSVYHNNPERIAEYLERENFATQCGLWINSPLLRIDPVEHNFYEHLEYAPLVNPRAHKVGKEYKILNTRFRANYDRFMNILSYKPELSDEDKLAVAWAMSLQDRTTDAINWFGKVDRKNIAEQVQYDYLDAYLAFYRSDVKRAESIASGYAEYHVDRWRNKFKLVLAQAKEIQGEGALTAADRRNRDQAQSVLATTEPALEMKVESGSVRLKGANIEECSLNFYPIDIELLFSRAPFVEAGEANYSSVRPALVQSVKIKAANSWEEVRLPQQFASKNVMVEAVAAGVRRSQVYYANTLDVQMVERYGQLTVRHAESGAPLPAVYVKVYAKMAGGEDKFFKDGYTDLRGRFDYVSLNSNEIENVDKLAVLVMSDELGAVVREALPPSKVR